MPPGFDRLESFGHDELTAKHCYFRCSRPPDVDGIKIDDQAAKHCDQNFQAYQNQEALAAHLISHLFSARPVLVLGRHFFTPGVFLIRYNVSSIYQM